MKWILYLMIFVTPAANVTSRTEKVCLSHDSISQLDSIFECRPKYEGKHLWALQSTSQLEFSNLQSCVKTQDQLIANSNVASTLTMRSWCFCDSDRDECPTEQRAEETVDRIRSCEKNPKDPKCDEVQKSAKVFGPDPARGGGQSSTSIQMYPPQRRR
jgi:hypothetical protein